MTQVALSLPRRQVADTEPEPDFHALVGDAGWRRLHPDIRDRFAPGHADRLILYRGRMTVRCSPIGRVFALLARMIGGPLPTQSASGLPAEVRVVADRRGGVIWERRLRMRAGRPPTRICSTKRTGPGGALLECVEGGLGMVLAVFEDGGSLVFESRRYFFDLGRLRLPIPAILTPGRCRVAHIAAGPRRFRFALDIEHPVWGRTFVQDGLFDDPDE